MNILLVSNSDICRSRMAQKILSSFGYGTKIFTSGVRRLSKKTGEEVGMKGKLKISFIGDFRRVR